MTYNITSELRQQLVTLKYVMNNNLIPSHFRIRPLPSCTLVERQWMCKQIEMIPFLVYLLDQVSLSHSLLLPLWEVENPMEVRNLWLLMADHEMGTRLNGVEWGSWFFWSAMSKFWNAIPEYVLETMSCSNDQLQGWTRCTYQRWLEGENGWDAFEMEKMEGEDLSPLPLPLKMEEKWDYISQYFYILLEVENM